MPQIIKNICKLRKTPKKLKRIPCREGESKRERERESEREQERERERERGWE